ncbi:type IV pilin protein [Thermodesulfobacteriota bacterium]
MTSMNGKGFTLIELMIVIAIIGILAAIAVPQFSSYRVKAFHGGVMSDMKNVATAQEAYYVSYKTYTATMANLSGTVGLSRTDGVFISMSKTDTTYTMTGYHSSGNKTFTLIGPGGSISSN